MFIEVEQLSNKEFTRQMTLDRNKKTNITGRISLSNAIINTDDISNIYVYKWNWRDEEELIVDEDKIEYTIYFKSNPNITMIISKNSYDKIKKALNLEKDKEKLCL